MNYGARRHWFHNGKPCFANCENLVFFWHKKTRKQHAIDWTCFEMLLTMYSRKLILMDGPDQKSWINDDNHFSLHGRVVGNDIKNTVCGAQLDADIIQSIMMFVEWPDTIKFGYLSDAVIREIQVVFEKTYRKANRQARTNS
jgi:hypothetical protein